MAKIVTTSFFLFSLLALYYWQRSNDVDETQAGLLTLLFALMPATYAMALSLLSENVFLFFSVCALLSMEQGERTQDRRWYIGASFCIAATYLTRSAGLALLAAYCLHLLLRRPARWTTYIAVAALPLFIWQLITPQHSQGYIAVVLRLYQSDPLKAILVATKIMSFFIFETWLELFSPRLFGIYLTSFIGLLCLAGMFYRILLRKTDGIYVALYLMALVLWFQPAHLQRFLYIAFPILLVQGWLFVRYLAGWVTGSLRRTTQWGVFFFYVISMFFVALPTLSLAVTRYFQTVPAPYADYAVTVDWYLEPNDAEAARKVMLRKAAIASMKNMEDVIPKDECVFSTMAPLVAFYSKRDDYDYPQQYLDNSVFRETLEKKNCGYFFFTKLITPGFPEPFYPSERMKSVPLKQLQITRLTDNEKSAIVSVLAVRQ